LSTPACGGEPQRPNIILLVVDTLRADYLGVYGFAGPISENLDELAAESLLFTNAFAPSPWTKPSMASLFTSLHPRVHGVTNHRGVFWSESEVEDAVVGILPERATTLAESLRAAGYATAAFVSNPWLRAELGFGQGFDLYDDSHAESFTRDASPVPVEELTSAARAWLESPRARRPFFLYLHLMNVHNPYGLHARRSDFDALAASPAVASDQVLEESQTPHQRWPNMERRPEWASDEMRREVSYWRTRYASGVRSLDRHLGAFLGYLRESARLEDSYLVFTSDHGEELFEHGDWSHGKNLHAHQLHVPLIVRAPGGRDGGRRIDEVVDLIDLMPTFLSIAGGAPEPRSQGHDLSGFFAGETPQLPGVSVASATFLGPDHYAMRTRDHKLILDLETGAAQLYDPLSDPREQRDRAGSPESAQVVDRLRQQLTRRIAESLAQGSLGRETTALPEGLKEQLEALGYSQ
jgi:arylsulfatase A-like enzyme